MKQYAKETKKLYEESDIDQITLYESKRIASTLCKIHLKNGVEKVYQILRHQGACAIIAFDENFVYLVSQYRHANQKIFLELPAGLIEENESIEKAAQRELQEEIGFKAQKLSLIKTIYTSPGILEEKIHLFLATDLIYQPIFADDTHEIDVVKIKLVDAISQKFISELEDAKTI
ncbi:MAG: NUDIX hydrolase, partial [Chlamydiae bacterium]|nr:NUDIX hydrolase [Chlamydiota bacterium]